MAKRKKRATKPKAKGRTTNIVVAKTRHHGKRRTTRRAVRGTSVGSTAVGKSHHRRKRRKSSGSVMGFTSAGLKLKDGLMMAAGVGAGIIFNHKVLRPLEAHLVEKMPMAAKFIGVGQTALGFIISVRGKHPWMKAAGITLMGGGVNSIIRVLDLEKHIPGISGAGDDWTTVRIPISGAGELKSMVAGLLESNKPPKWGMVAGDGMGNMHHHMNHSGAKTFSNSQSQRLNNQQSFINSQVAGDKEDVESQYTMYAKG